MIGIEKLNGLVRPVLPVEKKERIEKEKPEDFPENPYKKENSKHEGEKGTNIDVEV